VGTPSTVSSEAVEIVRRCPDRGSVGGVVFGMRDRPAVINSIDAQSAHRRMTGGMRRSTFDP
jgi:hypothetical protein